MTDSTLSKLLSKSLPSTLVRLVLTGNPEVTDVNPILPIQSLCKLDVRETGIMERNGTEWIGRMRGLQVVKGNLSQVQIAALNLPNVRFE